MAQPIVKIRGVSKSFGSKNVLNDLNLEIIEGEIFGIIGTSGAGKTTLLESLVGFISLNKGEVAYRKDDVGNYSYISVKKDPGWIKSSIGFSTQDSSFYDKLTVKENLEYFANLYNIKEEFIPKRIAKIIALVELTGEENTLSSSLSGGMQKRLDIACSLINDPKILIMDEPTADLDPVLRKHIWALIKKINKLGKTVIISSHFLEEMDALCDRIGIIYDKSVAHVGSMENLRKNYPYTKEILLTTASKNYNYLASKLKGLPITKMAKRGDAMVIYTKDAEDVLKHLVEILEHEEILDLELQKPTLDELFAAVIRGKK